MSYFEKTQILAANTPSIDSFGRWRSSDPLVLFSSKLLTNSQSLYWDDQQVSGSGTTSNYVQSKVSVELGVSNTTSGRRIRQTRVKFNYQPGKSQLALMTFNLSSSAGGISKRVGLYDDNNGLFLEQTGSFLNFVVRKGGSDTRISQSQWSDDKLNGSGPSNQTFDPTKVQIFFTDFEWLGVGTVRFGFVINGNFIICHRQHTANIGNEVYMSNPNLPVRYEIVNNGTGPASKMDCICCSINAEGGSKEEVIQRSIDRVITPLTTLNNTSIYPILGLRMQPDNTQSTIRIINASLLNPTNSTFRWIICLRPTLSGTAPTWLNLPNSVIQYCNTTTNATTISNTGIELSSGYEISSNGNQISTRPEIRGFLTVGSSISGEIDEIWLAAQRIIGGTEEFYGSIQFTEQT